MHKFTHGLATITALAALLMLAPGAALAQEDADAVTEESNKGEEIFDKVIEALGGDAYLNLPSFGRRGRLYDFDRGVLTGPGTRFTNYLKFPDKEWLEFGKRGNIVYLYNGDAGWELDKQGITDASPESVETWSETSAKDPEYLIRFRVREEKLPIYYNGTEFLDNRVVHILEIIDSDSESMVLYIDSNTYLPMQLRYSRHNELLRARVPIIEYYGKYIEVGGVMVPYHITRVRNGERVLEVFMKDVWFDEELTDEFFTLESLEARWKKVKR